MHFGEVAAEMVLESSFLWSKQSLHSFVKCFIVYLLKSLLLFVPEMAAFQQGMECFLPQFCNEGTTGKKAGYIRAPVTATRYSGVQLFVPFGGFVCLQRMLFLGWCKVQFFVSPFNPTWSDANLNAPTHSEEGRNTVGLLSDHTRFSCWHLQDFLWLTKYFSP